MKNRWNDRAARSFIARYRSFGEDVALRTYSARLIGQDPELVLHGGGNTSVKSTGALITGEATPLLYVKGSGWDLATIEPAGHPALRLPPLLALRRLPALSDEQMVNALRTQMLDSQGPNPSVETLLHAFLPHKFIDHTHANAILAWADQSRPLPLLAEWTDGRLAVVPYVMPGFRLAKLAAEIYEKNPSVEGLLLLKHGLFTFGATAQESYDRMIAWVSRAERALRRKRPVAWSRVEVGRTAREPDVEQVATVIRSEIRLAVEGPLHRDRVIPLIVRFRSSRLIRQFVDSGRLRRLSQRGPATPDHVIRTKGVPLILPVGLLNKEGAFRDQLRLRLARYQSDYRAYFNRQSRAKGVKRQMLDTLPRVVLVPGAGAFGLGEDAQAADIALDVYEATIGIIANAERVGRYAPVGESDLFDMEYWSLEQAKLGKSVRQPFSGKVVWVSGGASGIGLATAKAFAAAGAHVFLADRDASALQAAVQALRFGKRMEAGACDVTDPAQVQASVRACCRAFGGLDIVVSNAGAGFTGAMESLDAGTLRKSFEVNFFSHQQVAQAAVPILKRQRLGGVLLFNASKSAFNPGPDFGPYSLPKAGVVALMRQYAVELGEFGIRSNAVNADRVRTRFFSDRLLRERAQARGVSVDAYLAGNLLREEVYAEDVAQAFLYLAQARKTTGAVLPVDGGNAAAFPR